jgi:hypothetical protein
LKALGHLLQPLRVLLRGHLGREPGRFRLRFQQRCQIPHATIIPERGVLWRGSPEPDGEIRWVRAAPVFQDSCLAHGNSFQGQVISDIRKLASQLLWR